MAKMGRPRIEIDFEELNNLCEIHCTQVEIAAFFKCSEDTIEARIKEQFDMTFPEYFRIHSCGGKRSLRREQWVQAIKKKNIPMLIHLGKVYLDQSYTSKVEMPQAENWAFIKKE